MMIENLPLFFGFNRIDPIGNVSVFDKNVEETFIRDLELIRQGKIHEVPRYFVSFEGRVNEEGINIVSFAFVPEPVTTTTVARLIKEQ